MVQPWFSRFFKIINPTVFKKHTILLFNIAMENVPFTDDFPQLFWGFTIFNGKTHYKWPFSIAMLVYQRVCYSKI